MNPFILLETAPADAEVTNQLIMQIVMIVGMVAIMYFLIFRPQRKRQKQEEKMRSEIQVGDTIITIGGIVGKIVTIKEDSLIIETGVDRCRMQITKWAIQNNKTQHESDAK